MARRLALLLVGFCGLASAAWQSTLSVGSIELQGWRLEDVRFELASDARLAAGAIRFGRVHAPDGRVIEQLALFCENLRASLLRGDCQGGELRLAGQPILRVPSLGWWRSDGMWRLQATTLELSLDRAGELLALLAPGWSLAGTLQLGLEATVGGGSTQLHLRLISDGLSLSNADSSLATDTLVLRADLRLRQDARGLRLRGEAELSGGYAYLAPVLQDYGAYPAHLQFDALWQGPAGLSLQALLWQQPGVGHFHARGHVVPGADQPLRALQLGIEDASLPGLYAQLLEPFLAGTPLDELDSEGRIDGEIVLERGAPQAVTLRLRQLHLDDRSRRFAVYGLSGELSWVADAQPPASELSWEGLYLGRMPFGGARWRFLARAGDIDALTPLRMRLFDGAIRIEDFQARDLGSPQRELGFQASLEPVSLSLLSAAWGLPSFPGTIAGRLPPLQFSGQRLQVLGEIRASAFGGELQIRDLVVDEPLGLVPRASLDLALHRLDLAQLTSVFDFGRIQGRLNLELDGLRLQQWRPVAFKARLYTPADDSSPRRISQRAVNNISRVGGGGAVAALSSGLMRYFDSFGYRRIGWSCTLRRGVCQMGGVGPARDGRGYVLVEGRGLPRIEVVGHAQEVSWESLLSQLRNLSQGRPAGVQ